MNNITYNFKLEEDSTLLENENVISRKLKDSRNGVSVINLIPGLDSYINYLELLVYYRSKWVSNCYLDLGMIPVIYGPSFLHSDLTNAILKMAYRKEVILVPMPYSSFLLPVAKDVDIIDYWITRKEAARFLGCGEFEVSSKAVIEKLRGE